MAATKKAKRLPGQKSAVKRRTDIARPFCGGLWSEARMRGFAMSALRRAQWPPRFNVIDRAFTGYGINPATGRKCKLHKCEECGVEYPKGKMKADHDEPVIPIEHDWAADEDNFLGYNFNEVMRRLWIEAEAGWNVICESCHNSKSAEEKAQRAAHKKNEPKIEREYPASKPRPRKVFAPKN
jgi:5-methylcytosine-specific restriction endonuclease McrA